VGSNWLLLRSGRLGGQRVGRFVVISAHRIPKISQSSAERAAHLGEPLRAEHKQRDHKDEQEMSGLKNVANHCRTA
jgi:hypothetical protein